jgi:guanylate kinase
VRKRVHPQLLTGRVIILSGPSGAGKTTLHDLLLKDPRFAGRIVRSVSATTRLPRAGERHGRDYFFLTPRMFDFKVRAGHFLEWMKVFDRHYGTPWKNVRDILASGRHVLLCIDVKGARAVKERMPDALTIFIKTPTIEELRRRLEQRGTDAGAEIALRLKTAAEELAHASGYRHVIVNDTIDSAYRQIVAILVKELGV